MQLAGETQGENDQVRESIAGASLGEGKHDVLPNPFMISFRPETSRRAGLCEQRAEEATTEPFAQILA